MSVDLRAWVGRTEVRDDVVTASPLVRLAGVLDRSDDVASGDVPPLWHWLYFLDAPAQRDLGPDGHPARGGFLPPVTLPRRMYAGFRLHRGADPRLGTRARKTSTVADVAEKEGRTGPLVVVTVEHRVEADGEELLVEEQDIVYTGASPAAVAGSRAETGGEAPSAPLEHDLRPDPTLLFRFSALTFNGHRIHYDHPYATGVEGYPGLVVHGPLIALLLGELARSSRPGAALAGLEFRSRRPVFEGEQVHLRGWPADGGERVELTAYREDGTVAAEAGASFGPGAAPDTAAG